MKPARNDYENLVNHISEIVNSARVRALTTSEQIMLLTYWAVGYHVVEYEQQGSDRAAYGQNLLPRLAKDLTSKLGKGFSRSNLIYMRMLYLRFSTMENLSPKLTWAHYVELLKIEDELERRFFERQCELERWSVRELKRQKSSLLFHRLAASKDKEGILQLARQGQIIEKPEDLLREPYVLDFLKISEPWHLSESELEERLITHLQHFLLELGKGFAFIGRQYRITLGNRHHRVDLVFYHRILKCFVLIDLKKDEADYGDIGQMNMYLGYFEEEENTEGDNPPIGIVLAKEKDEMVVRYAMKHVSSQLFVQKYQLYLPGREELRRELEAVLSKEDEAGEAMS